MSKIENILKLEDEIKIIEAIGEIIWQKKEETEDEKMLTKLRTESRMSKEAATLDGLLPTIKREPGKAISDADLEKLFFALCGDTGTVGEENVAEIKRKYPKNVSN